VPGSVLEEGLLRLGLGAGGTIPDSILSLLNRYIEEIELFNPAYGLVKVKDRQELVIKHILDSLSPINIIRNLLKETSSVADAGSGAGLPGIPLAICLPGINFTLIERMGRRAGFLCNTLAVLGLSNVRVEERDIEKMAREAAGGFDLIVFRAFRPLEPFILKSLADLLAPGGVLAAYKGRLETIEEEIKMIPAHAGNGAEPSVFPLEVPFLEEERHLLVIRSFPK
jgi:16S rRNA (guanine527-N7)-methyltransferase